MSDRESYLILFIPWLILFLVFTFGFAGFNLLNSFTDWQGLYPSYNFVGFKNYAELPQMTGFLDSIKNTGLLFGLGLPIAMLVSISLGVLIDIMGKIVAGVFRSVAIVSMAIGGVMVAVFWVWKFAGYGGLIIYGGLQSIPKSHIETAKLAGASTLQIYFRVMLPQVIGPIITTALLLSMFMLKSFGYVWPLTGGGPGWSSTLFPVLIYRKMFEATNFSGGAAAVGFVPGCGFHRSHLRGLRRSRRILPEQEPVQVNRNLARVGAVRPLYSRGHQAHTVAAGDAGARHLQHPVGRRHCHWIGAATYLYDSLSTVLQAAP